MEGIARFLPNNQYMAAMNAAAPTAANPFATMADLAGTTTIYTGDGTISAATRNVEINTTLNFNHGAAGVNGYVRMSSGGYFKNQTSIATNYFEYNNANGILTLQTDTHSVTGIRANNDGGVGNPTAMAEVVAGSNGTAYLNVGATTTRFDFYVNNTSKLAASVLGGSGAFNGSWGFGTSATTAAKVHILGENGQGSGTIIQSMNVSPAENIIEIRDAANVARMSVSATGITFVNNRAFIGSNLGSVVSSASVVHKGADSAFATTNTEYFDGSNNVLWKMQNDGSIGINTAPVAGDRLKITAGGGRDGAINISASNLANNGYSLLAQGTSVGANYYGIWSDAQGATSVCQAFKGSSLASGVTSNYGGHFTARNGTSDSIGVAGIVAGGDSVASTYSAGVFASNSSTQSTTRRGVWAIVTGNIANGSSYGLRAEVDAAGANALNYAVSGLANATVASGTNYGGHFFANGSGITTNIGVYAKASGGGNNYALICDGGSVGIGTTAPDTNCLVELASTNQAFRIMQMTSAQAGGIAALNGMMLYVTDTDGTFTSVGFWGYEAGAWVKL